MHTHQFQTHTCRLLVTRLVLLLAFVLFFPRSVCAQAQENGDQASALKPVTQERLVKGTAQYTDWLMYGGNYDNSRFSPLTDIDRQNVKKLSVAWVFQTGIPYQFQASPIVADGILYVTTAYNHLFALDAVTGDPLWKYDHKLPTDLRMCCGPGNRGVAIADDKVFMGTLDARLVALDRKTGQLMWNVEVEKYTAGYSITAAPLVVKDLDEKGRPMVNPEYVPTKEGGKMICPGPVGGQNGSYTAAYSPIARLLFIPVIESCMEMIKAKALFIQGIPYWGGGPGKSQGDDGSSYGHLAAIDPTTGETKWRYVDDYPLMGGTLATAGGLVFTGNQSGYAMAFDDTSGELLWKFQTGSIVRGQPITYKVGGRQYVAIPSGAGGLAVTVVGENTQINKGSALVVFALPE